MDHLVSWWRQDSLKPQRQWRWLLISERTQPCSPRHPVSVPVATASFCHRGITSTQDLKWELYVREHRRGGSFCCSRGSSTCQSQWWWTSTLPSLSPSSHLPSLSAPPCCHCWGQEQATAYLPCSWEGGQLQSATPLGPATLWGPSGPQRHHTDLQLLSVYSWPHKQCQRPPVSLCQAPTTIIKHRIAHLFLMWPQIYQVNAIHVTQQLSFILILPGL